MPSHPPDSIPKALSCQFLGEDPGRGEEGHFGPRVAIGMGISPHGGGGTVRVKLCLPLYWGLKSMWPGTVLVAAPALDTEMGCPYYFI